METKHNKNKSRINETTQPSAIPPANYDSSINLLLDDQGREYVNRVNKSNKVYKPYR